MRDSFYTGCNGALNLRLTEINQFICLSKGQISPITSTMICKFVNNITNNNWKTGVNILALVNRFRTSNVKCWTANFCVLASESPVIIMNQLKYFTMAHSKIYIHTLFTPIAR